MLIFHNNSTTNDHFDTFYSNYASSPTTIFVYIVGLITGIFGPMSVIWYERNCGNRFRTIINQMFAATHWYLLLYTLFVYIPDGIRFLSGPYGEMFCNVHGCIRNVLWTSLLLTVDSMLVLRYVFVFCMKNFADVNDDLLARLLNMSIWTISAWGYAVRHFTPGNPGVVYHMCSGMDPNVGMGEENHLEAPTKYRSERVVEVVSFVLHLLMIPRLLYYQIGIKLNERPITLGTVNSKHAPNVPAGERVHPSHQTKPIKRHNNTTTLFGLITQFTMLAIVSGIGITALFSHGSDSGQHKIEDYPDWIPLLRIIYCPVIGMISSVIVVFVKNSGLRETACRRLTSLCTRNQVGVQNQRAFYHCKV